MDLMLRDRVILVVGGTGFIGSAIASRIRDEGGTIVVASRSGTDGIVLDAGDPASVTQGVARVVDEFGRLDGLVVSAAPAAQSMDPSRNNDPAQVAATFDGKALSFLRVANEVLPTMREAGFGRIVGISGQNAFITGSIAGSVRNAAMNVIAKNLADDAAGSGVLVNTVNPGFVKVDPATDVQQGRGGESTPHDIAALVAFLVSPLSAVSGESLAIGHRVRGVL